MDVWCFYFEFDLLSSLDLKTILMEKNVHRGFYMSAHVLLNLLNELGKRISRASNRFS